MHMRHLCYCSELYKLLYEVAMLLSSANCQLKIEAKSTAEYTAAHQGHESVPQSSSPSMRAVPRLCSLQLTSPILAGHRALTGCCRHDSA